mmetsp:Transcript_10740/g.18033  ORF Transcript_10740/g.18033 Transcript_10740/m.18033 type:complete len:111 (+) Transcript_10740:1703-2035(+)
MDEEFGDFESARAEENGKIRIQDKIEANEFDSDLGSPQLDKIEGIGAKFEAEEGEQEQEEGALQKVVNIDDLQDCGQEEQLEKALEEDEFGEFQGASNNSDFEGVVAQAL